MATPLENLERAYDETMAAEGADFFRRLRDYEKLLHRRGPIKRAVKGLNRRVKRADKKFVGEDDGFVRELETYRNNLVRRVPETDDSSKRRPEANGQRAPARSLEGNEWAYTLANFDAVKDDREDRILIGQGLDHGRSGMLVAILDTKLVDLRFPRKEPASGVMNREEEDQRPDLEDLHQGVGEVMRKEETAYRRAEQTLEDNGVIALVKVERVARLLEPQDPLPKNTDNEKLIAFNEALREATTGYHHLRDAIRPPEAGHTLSADAQQILDYHEGEMRKVLPRLHRPLRDALESSRQWTQWSAYSRNEKLTALGVIVAILGIVVAVILAA